MGLFDFGAGGLRPVGGGTGLRAVPGAEQAVRHALHLGLAGRALSTARSA
jgi:hypothetical protein